MLHPQDRTTCWPGYDPTLWVIGGGGRLLYKTSRLNRKNRSHPAVRTSVRTKEERGVPRASRSRRPLDKPFTQTVRRAAVILVVPFDVVNQRLVFAAKPRLEASLPRRSRVGHATRAEPAALLPSPPCTIITLGLQFLIGHPFLLVVLQGGGSREPYRHHQGTWSALLLGGPRSTRLLVQLRGRPSPPYELHPATTFLVSCDSRRK